MGSVCNYHRRNIAFLRGLGERNCGTCYMFDYENRYVSFNTVCFKKMSPNSRNRGHRESLTHYFFQSVEKSDSLPDSNEVIFKIDFFTSGVSKRSLSIDSFLLKHALQYN